jgi:hypothetical protein
MRKHSNQQTQFYTQLNKNQATTNKPVLKVKVSRNSPGVAQKVPGVLGSQIFMTFGT